MWVKSSTIVVHLSILYNFIQFCYEYFEALLLGTHKSDYSFIILERRSLFLIVFFVLKFILLTDFFRLVFVWIHLFPSCQLFVSFCFNYDSKQYVCRHMLDICWIVFIVVSLILDCPSAFRILILLSLFRFLGRTLRHHFFN